MEIATNLAPIATTLILGAVLILREHQNWKDRRELLDRVMCVDYTEYRRSTKPPQPSGPSRARMTDAELAKIEAERKNA